MTDRPTLFSAPMIRALLDGRKTQTRRIIKDRGVMPQFCGGRYDDRSDPECWGWADHGRGEWITIDQWRHWNFVPYRPGDRLWVRETCRAVEHEDGTDAVEYLADGACARIANTMQAADQWGKLYQYGKKGPDRANREGQKVPPIHMPRWASRLTLTVTDVRVQRLQEISRGDAMDEGCPFPNMAHGPNPQDWFAGLWNGLYGLEAWGANPWVCAISFDVHRCNIDEMASTS